MIHKENEFISMTVSGIVTETNSIYQSIHCSIVIENLPVSSEKF